MSSHDAQPSFGLAVVAVLAAGATASAASQLLIGHLPFVSLPGAMFAGSMLGGVAIWAAMRLLGYEIAYVVGVVSLLLGSVVGVALSRTMAHTGWSDLPVVVSFFSVAISIPAVLLSALLVQLNAHEPKHHIPHT
jgi:hypothetical protein